MIHEKILSALRTEINEQTAQLPWTELQRFFANGSVVAVAPELDLIDVGARFAADDKASVEAWLRAGLVCKASDQQASDWHDRNAMLWTVVVKPWILVQQRQTQPESGVH